MKKLRLLPLLLILVLAFTGCFNRRTITYSVYKPVYLAYDQLRKPVEAAAARTLGVPGKIYYTNGYLLINEKNKGVHIIDNRDPNDPLPIAFLPVLGNADMAVKGNYLYVDSYTDLVVFDITTPASARQVQRINDVFPYYFTYPASNDARVDYPNQSLGVVVDWTKTEETVDADHDPYGWCGTVNAMEGDVVTMDGKGAPINNGSQTPTNAPQNGNIGGSMARFTVVNNFLYTVNNYSLKSFDVSDGANPVTSSEVSVGWQIETIFPQNGYLFIGSNNRMYVYGLNNPAQPNLISEIQHFPGCDPIYVSGNTAFVTTHSGDPCGNAVNELQVVNIDNISSPQLLYTYPMTNPHGLTVDGNLLFLCDGSDGLKVYDVSDLSNIGSRRLAHFPEMQAYDAIHLDNTLMLIGENGLYQYDYSNPNSLKLLSTINVNGI